jgi:hypothetical protein
MILQTSLKEWETHLHQISINKREKEAKEPTVSQQSKKRGKKL